MSEPLHERRLADIATPEKGDTPSAPRPVPSSCSFCGERARAEDPPVERFGEVFCSVEHADAFVLEVRRARVQTAASVGVPDAQAAYESQWNLWPCVLAHSNLVMHAVGWLEGGLTVSYEKIVIDAESLAMFQHFLQGFAINAETLALDMIAEVGPGGHHFGTPHTQARFSTEFYQSSLADRLNYESWLAAGSQDTARRANAIWKEILAQYEAPPLDPGIRDALEDYVARRERELEGRSLYD